MDPSIKVLLIDDSEYFRQAVRRSLKKQPSLEIVGEGRDGHEAVALAEQHRPDVVIIDYCLPNLDGIAAAREIRSRFPATQVIVLSMFADDMRQEAADAGACLCIGKDENLRQLPEMVAGCYWALRPRA